MVGFIALFAGFFLFSWGGLNCVSGDSLKPCEFPAIYNFGDSNSATGGSQINPPAPNKDKRICDGYLVIDFIAEHLKLPYLSGYVNSSQKGNFRHGANFAEPGSTIGKSKNVNISSLEEQIDQFNELKSETTKHYSEGMNDSEKDQLPKQEDFANALYTFDIGKNDFADVNLTSMDELGPTVTDLVTTLASSIQNIYEQGGRTFRIHNMGPIGCLPEFVMQNKNSSAQGNVDEHGCVKSRNNMAIEFNKQLKEKAIKLRSDLPEAAITYVDMYAARYGLISNATKLGFGDPFNYCCGRDWNLMCGEKKIINGEERFGDACKEPSKHIYWDKLHYTQVANKLVADQILNGSLVDPPIPITQSCHSQ